MKILIIGGTRFVGLNLIELLLKNNEDITILSRGNSRPDWWNQVKHIIVDRKDISMLKQKLKGFSFDIVIDTQAFFKEDVEYIFNILNGQMDRYFFISSTSVYRDILFNSFKIGPLKEEYIQYDLVAYDFPDGFNQYGVGKRHCEKWLIENSKIPYTIFRFPKVFGENDPTLRTWWWLQRALDGASLIIPLEYREMFQFVYIKDLINGIYQAIYTEKTKNQIYNLAMSEIVTVENWADILWTLSGHQLNTVYIPGDVIAKKLGQYDIPLYNYSPYIFNTDKARKDLAFKTTPIVEWLKYSLTWYKANKFPNSKGYEKRDQEILLAKSWNY